MSCANQSIGNFTGQKGQRYVLVVDSLTDGSELDEANPHIRVVSLDRFYELSLVIGGLLRLTCIGLALIGVALGPFLWPGGIEHNNNNDP